ncbi:hypothetical protein KUTG_04175, partial [Kutzneria sp. 744]
MSSSVDGLADRPGHAKISVVRVPATGGSPIRTVTRRLVFALLALAVTVVIVYLDRGGYRDANGATKGSEPGRLPLLRDGLAHRDRLRR